MQYLEAMRTKPDKMQKDNTICQTLQADKEPSLAPSHNANSKCVVLVPTQDTIEGGCEECLHEMEKAGYTVWRRWGCSDMSVARNYMAALAIEQGFEELMWIDSDMLFDPIDVKVLR